MARSEPALTVLAGAMVGLAMAVAAVLAERQSSSGAAGVTAGVSADLIAGVVADQGGSVEAMSWRPPAWRVGIFAGSRVLSSPGCADAARFALEQGNRQPAPLSAVRAGAGFDPGNALEEGGGVLASLAVGRTGKGQVSCLPEKGET